MSYSVSYSVSFSMKSLNPAGTARKCWVFLVAMLLAIGCAATEADHEVVEDTFPVGPAARLVVVIENGSVRVDSAASAVNMVRVTATIKDPRRVNYESSLEDNTVKLTGEVDGGFRLFGAGGGVDLVVSVPPEITLDLKSSNGRINVDGVKGPISVATSNGQVSIANAGGAISARTSNGGVSITNSVGEVTANTSNGRITIADVTGQIDAHTSNGAIDFRGTLPPGSNNTLRTSNGGIEVELVNTAGVELSATADNASVHSSLPVTMIGKREDNRLEGTIGGGGSTLEIRTSNGSINIK